MYRQFAITIAVSVTISGFVALTLTPAMCAALLKTGESEPTGLLARFDAAFRKLTHAYTAGVRWTMRHGAVAVAVIVLMVVAIWWLERSVPSALAPTEDQGYVIAIAALPPAASLQRTKAALDAARQGRVRAPGLRRQHHGRRLGRAHERPAQQRGRELHLAQGLVGAARSRRCRRMRWQARCSAQAWASRTRSSFSLSPPAVEGMSNTGGFEGFVQSRTNDYAALERATQALVAAAAKRTEVTGVGTSYSAQVPRVNVAIDLEKAKLLHVSIDDVNITLQSTFGAFYVNDFNRDGRVYRVLMQSDGKFRAHPEDLRDVFVRAANGSMIPLTAIATVQRNDGAGFDRALQPVPVRAPVRRAGAGLQLGPRRSR